MAEQLLDRAQVGAALQQVRRERVPQRVRADAEAACCTPRRSARTSRSTLRAGQPRRRGSSRTAARRRRSRLRARRSGAPAARASRRRRWRCGADAAARDPAATRAAPSRSLRVERHEPLLAALAEHPHHPRAQVDVLEVEPDQLAQAQPRGVEQLEDRAVAPAERRATCRASRAARHLVDRRGAPASAARASASPTSAAGIAVDQPFAPQVAARRSRTADELARRRRARLPLRVQLGRGTPRIAATIEVRRRAARRACAGWPAATSARNCDEVALVGADGVRRDVAIEAQVARGTPRAAPSSMARVRRRASSPALRARRRAGRPSAPDPAPRSRSASARVRHRRLARPSCRAAASSSGGMMPNVMLVGW